MSIKIIEVVEFHEWCSGLRGFRVIFSPDLLKLIQVMRTEKRPITGQIVKVVHDDSHKQVEDLRRAENKDYSVV